ncbi:hypothetical protein CYMTET_8397 [Cymbomonas tetramitiformis]|uniref:Uncharacterized protein n=1 Tax=Cymbomonas tetramitiformis TaxID=36881 RepID=A0AAE0GTT4_9CHLO|nr:hypothetical protein CYMTET_8397 [Cymbomonas tetramitiformis]
MVGRERCATDAEHLPPFWERRTERGQTVYFNTITCSSQAAKPAPVCGGILADEMGLGKTLHVLGVMIHEDDADSTADPGPHRTVSSAPAPDEDMVQVFKKQKVSELAAAAVARGLPKSGPKDKLIQRLVDYEHKQQASSGGAREAGVASPAASKPPPANAMPRRTLVVCPTSVISNWQLQAAQHVAPEMELKVYVHHGTDRCFDSRWIASQDLVITSYSTLAAELPDKQAGPGGQASAKRKLGQGQGLFEVEWRRVVLDEAHVIRNRGTRSFAACMRLRSRARWCITGTPLQNRVEDVQSLFQVLRAAPVDDFSVFNRSIARPLRSGDMAALARLRVLLNAVCLRRSKAILEAKLPKKVVEVHTVKLLPEAQAVYDALFASSRVAVRAMLATGRDDQAMRHYSSVLECILRLRQVCCSPELVPGTRVKAAKQVLAELTGGGTSDGKGKAHELGPEDAARLFGQLKGALQEAEDRECVVCFSEADDVNARILRACSHVFCAGCLGQILATGGDRSSRPCPLCRCPFSSDDILDLRCLKTEVDESSNTADVPESDLHGAAQGGGNEAVDGAAQAGPSGKVQALLEHLHGLLQADPGAKAVVFSQFVTFLDVVQHALHTAGVQVVRLDGSMARVRRDTAIRSFNSVEPGSPAVFLISTKAGGVGLNLTAANHVFMMDVWWNAAADEQAMDRVHRLGQQRDVTVVRYVAENTIEEKILQIQERKRVLGAGALRRLSPEEIRRSRVADLRLLFEVDQ